MIQGHTSLGVWPGVNHGKVPAIAMFGLHFSPSWYTVPLHQPTLPELMLPKYRIKELAASLRNLPQKSLCSFWWSFLLSQSIPSINLRWSCCNISSSLFATCKSRRFLSSSLIRLEYVLGARPASWLTMTLTVPSSGLTGCCRTYSRISSKSGCHKKQR